MGFGFGLRFESRDVFVFSDHKMKKTLRSLDELNGDNQDKEQDPQDQGCPGNKFLGSAFLDVCEEIQSSATAEGAGDSIGLSALHEAQQDHQNRDDHQEDIE